MLFLDMKLLIQMVGIMTMRRVTKLLLADQEAFLRPTSTPWSGEIMNPQTPMKKTKLKKPRGNLGNGRIKCVLVYVHNLGFVSPPKSLFAQVLWAHWNFARFLLAYRRLETFKPCLFISAAIRMNQPII